MDFDCVERSGALLYADLFKHRKELNQSTISPSPSASESSSSGFSTPVTVSSDLGSSESDDSDFIAELTRQMTDCMLQEDEQLEELRNIKNYNHQKFTTDNDLNNISYSNAICGVQPQSPNLEVYQLKNQPKQVQKAEQRHVRRYRGRDWRVGHMGMGHDGVGMRAVFLGESRFRNGSSGTGVFLPNDPVEQKKKSGCSTVLIPTRVLEALEVHFKRFPGAAAPPPSSPTPTEERTDEEMQLPQEWTY